MNSFHVALRYLLKLSKEAKVVNNPITRENEIVADLYVGGLDSATLTRLTRLFKGCDMTYRLMGYGNSMRIVISNL